MMDPFIVLNISRDADDATVRSAYLAAVRKFPSEHDAARFQLIQAAFDAIKDRKMRAQYLINNNQTPANSPFETLMAYVRIKEMHNGPAYFLKSGSFRDFLKETAAAAL